MAGYPVQALQQQMGQMSVHPSARAGDSPLLTMFSEGNVIVLQSQATGTNVRIYDGEVQGTGNEGPLSHFIVHCRRPGVVALQNKQNPHNWLGVFEGRTIGTGGGGPYCELVVGELEGRFVTFESAQYPGQKVGFFADGRTKPATETTCEDDGRFIPSVHSFAASPGQVPSQPVAAMPSLQGSMTPPQGHMPPPQGAPHASMAPGQYPPPQGAPNASMAPNQYPPPQELMAPRQYPPPQGAPQGYPQYPPGYGPPPTQGSMMPPPQGSMMPPQSYAPPPSSLPIGFNIMDAFRDGNVVYLISRSSGNPCNIRQGDISCSGRFGSSDSWWEVGAAPDKTITLTNCNWRGCSIAIRSSGKVLTTKGKKDKHAHLRVNAYPDNYVYFESVECPGSYVGFTSRGIPRRPRELAASEDDAKFFIRVDRQKHPYSCQIGTAYGWPSVFATLSDRSVIQLYVKGSSPHYLCINKSGNVVPTNNGNDEHTFFIWVDRGMGIISLQSRKYEGFRIRMTNFTIVGKGDNDLNADFRVKENSDRTISLESVTCPGGLLRVQVGNTGVDRLSVFLMTIQRFGRSETITKAPIN